MSERESEMHDIHYNEEFSTCWYMYCIRKNWCQKVFLRKITGLYKCIDFYVISFIVTIYTATSMADTGMFYLFIFL